ncbi:serine hydrolase FSH [Dipodascopsis uninucleata]
MSGKILFLHGYTQSGSSFAKKSAGLRKALTKLGFEALYATGPIALTVPEDASEEERARLSGIGYGEDSYAWFIKNDSTGNYDGIDKSWTYLSDYIRKQGPFVGAIGFSQGAGILGLLCNNLQKLVPEHPPLKFAVLFSGFRSTVPEHQKLYPITLPTLHVLGQNDSIVPVERSQTLVDASEESNRTVYIHPGGHFVPSNREVVTYVNNWILDTLKRADESDSTASAQVTTAAAENVVVQA